MAKIHDKFVIELAEVIKGYGNDPGVDDPFCLSEFYRFYELPNIAVSRENFEKMQPVEPERKTGRWIKLDSHAHLADHKCTACGQECYVPTCMGEPMYTYCPSCGARMEGETNG